MSNGRNKEGEEEQPVEDEEQEEEPTEDEEQEEEPVEDEEEEDDDECEQHPPPKQETPSAMQKPAGSAPTARATSKWKMWGWNAEIKKAWRATGPKPKDEKQFTNDIREPPNAEPEMPMKAFFDGESYDLTDLLVADHWAVLDAEKEDQASKTHATELWGIKHEASGLRLSVRPRKNGQTPLTSLFLGPNQICQIPVEIVPDIDLAVKILSAFAQDERLPNNQHGALGHRIGHSSVSSFVLDRSLTRFSGACGFDVSFCVRIGCGAIVPKS